MNKSYLKRIIKEELNELSYEFLKHAERMARGNGRARQAAAFRDGADRAFDRDYGFPYGPEDSEHSDDYFMNTREGGLVHRKSGYEDYPRSVANGYFRAAKRNKVLQGLDALDRAGDGLDPHGNPYPDEYDLEEAVDRIVRRAMRTNTTSRRRMY